MNRSMRIVSFGPEQLYACSGFFDGCRKLCGNTGRDFTIY